MSSSRMPTSTLLKATTLLPGHSTGLPLLTTGVQAVVDALTQYTAGTGDWSAVETAFVQGWATQYAKENA